MLVAFLIIDPADERVVIFQLRHAVERFAAFIERCRQLAGDLDSRRTERRRTDAVIHERCFQRNRPVIVALR